MHVYILWFGIIEVHVGVTWGGRRANMPKLICTSSELYYTFWEGRISLGEERRVLFW
jgi:hypothetical protein